MSHNDKNTPPSLVLSSMPRPGVLLLTLNNAPANAYSYEMMQALDSEILKARFDKEVHVIVLTGAGEKFFCAGADIGNLKQMTPHFKYNFCLHANETLMRLEQTPKLVIAALNGHTVGGGLEVALAADLRIASGGKMKIGLPEVALGVLPGTGGTQRLLRLIGRNKALELMIEGSNFSADRGVELGIVNKVLPADESGKAFSELALDYAERFVPPNKAALSVGMIKRAVVSGAEMGFSEGLALERELQQRLFASSDAKEGMAAFKEKRAPVFSGE